MLRHKNNEFGIALPCLSIRFDPQKSLFWNVSMSLKILGLMQNSNSARCLVPKLVQNGFYSYFTFLGLNWTCLIGKSWSVDGLVHSGSSGRSCRKWGLRIKLASYDAKVKLFFKTRSIFLESKLQRPLLFHLLQAKVFWAQLLKGLQILFAPFYWIAFRARKNCYT